MLVLQIGQPMATYEERRQVLFLVPNSVGINTLNNQSIINRAK